MINVCPIGRSCTQTERDDFEKYDDEHKLRKNMIEKMQENLKELNLTYSIGGQISFDVFPKGWDKTYCLQFVKNDFTNIYFFGDKTYKGGNDYEIYNSELTTAFTVKNPNDTISILNEHFI